MRKRILFFDPYGTWLVHNQVDAVLASSLRLRGADVLILGCDGVFAYCPLAGSPPRLDACEQCVKTSLTFFSHFNLPILWLSSLIQGADYRACENWALNIKVEDLENAHFEGAAIGKWVAAAMYQCFMSETLDYSDERVITIYRSYLYNGALIQRALPHVVEQFSPDYTVCYSGFHGYHRVFFEFFRSLGISVLVHERGEISTSFTFIEDETFHMYKHRLDVWAKWKNVPLTRAECKQIREYLMGREKRTDKHIIQSYNYDTEIKDVRKLLRIPSDAKIVVIFPTTDWEIGVTRKESPLKFPLQIDLLRYILQHVKLENTYLVIRYHPAQAHATRGVGKVFLQDVIRNSRNIPSEVLIREIMPEEKINSYALIWHTDAAFVVRSTFGMEAPFRGVATGSELNSIRNICGIEPIHGYDYEPFFTHLIEKSEKLNIEDLKQSYRGAYFYFFRLCFVFRSFGILNQYNYDIRIKSFDELAEGNDPTLDRVCRHILFDEPLYLLPVEEEMKRTSEEEEEFITEDLHRIKDMRLYVKKMGTDEKWCFEEKKIIVVRLYQNELINSQNTILSRSLARSRHKNIEKLELKLPADINAQAFITILTQIVNKANGDYIFLTPDNIHIDESCFSYALDFLEQPQNAALHGLVSGAWIMNEKGEIVNEIFTQRCDTKNYLEAMNIFPSIKNPIYLLPFIVWHKNALLGFLASELFATTLSSLSTALFERTLSAFCEWNLNRSFIPMLTIYPPSMDEDIWKQISQ